ncbi:MAG: tRNA-dihydrouridine synthase family protein [Bacteroides sp.]|nr:tRNA-dihydrouridine synthase family protein [Bacteroides sp.]
MQTTLLPIYFAPLQGYTEAAYRQAHARFFGGIESYYTPFIRLERGEVRRKDLRELEPENNRSLSLTPQLIAATPEVLDAILPHITAQGYRQVDINLGCPFPMLVKRHNGAGLLPYAEEIEALLRHAINNYPDIKFSVKMRLGWDSPEESMRLLPLLNTLPLERIVLHPRLGRQQYKGVPDLSAFEAFYRECEHPLIYNGDLLTVDDLQTTALRFPRLSGFMIGRGLLANPALALEYRQGHPLTPAELQERVRSLHAEVFCRLGNQLQGGDLQLLTKMKTFWEYLLPDADRKARKAIHKATKLEKYQAAVNNLLTLLL